MSSVSDCPFCNILNGVEPGTILARDDENGFAIIKSIHPESVVHWLAVPTDHIESTEVMEQTQSKRFLGLFEYAIREARNAVEETPQLVRGFTIKMHFGSYESVPHAKLHILAVE